MKYYPWIIAPFVFLLAACNSTRTSFIRVADDHRHFVFSKSEAPFIPWGHNYAVNDAGSDQVDWGKIAHDFDDFRRMRANVARVHLQMPHFMNGPDEPNPVALMELSRLLRLAKEKGIYLDITGLASYNIRRRAHWYDALSNDDRWKTQACFWEAVARTCKDSRAVFCYDLMNEPVWGGQRKDGWYAGRMGDYEFVQRLSLGVNDASMDAICRAWTVKMVEAIRKNDERHLITLGMLPAWGPSPRVVGPYLDFIAVHIYPSAGKVDASIKNLKQFDVGKPIVVEETFPLSCGVADEREFLLRSRGIAAGWIGQYPQESPDELLALKHFGKITLGQSAYLAWIELFREVGPIMLQPYFGK